MHMQNKVPASWLRNSIRVGDLIVARVETRDQISHANALVKNFGADFVVDASQLDPNANHSWLKGFSKNMKRIVAVVVDPQSEEALGARLEPSSDHVWDMRLQGDAASMLVRKNRRGPSGVVTCGPKG